MQAVHAGDRRRAAYVMGDDPEHMNVDAVIAARPLRRSVIRAATATPRVTCTWCASRPGSMPAASRWCAARWRARALSGCSS